MNIFYLLITVFSSTIGAICGIGGGVIIKPVLDLTGTLSVSTLSFLSGCTVLSMACVSVIRSLKGEKKLNFKISFSLAIGACVGGIFGKAIFNQIEQALSNNLVGMIQSVILLAINIFVLIYTINKKRIDSKQVSSIAVCISLGIALGLLSSFLGIGGGPINIVVLFFFFSMTPKQTAVNSLFIILCSQLTSLFSSAVTGSIPDFVMSNLIVMCFGGILGALIGSKISKRISEETVQKLFYSATILLICINILNIFKFSGLL